MGKAYPQEMRDRVLASYERGLKTAQIAERLDVCPAWARRVRQVFRETGRRTAKPMGGATVIKIDMERLRELVEQQPDATTAELHQQLRQEGADCVESAVGMALQRLNLTFKKRRSTRRSRTAPMSPPNARNGYVIAPSVMRDG